MSLALHGEIGHITYRALHVINENVLVSRPRCGRIPIVVGEREYAPAVVEVVTPGRDADLSGEDLACLGKAIADAKPDIQARGARGGPRRRLED
jgi:hypothetical protein